MEFRHGRHRGHEGAGEGPGQYFGTTTLGERGQIVIPKAARELFDLKAGDKLLVLGSKQRGGLALVKAELMERFAAMFLGGELSAEESDESGEDEGKTR
jgi:AbrB family looped-hinge helix DNA binding protein